MRDIQTVTIYYHAVYALAALIFGGYIVSIMRAAQRARARLHRHDTSIR